MMHKYETQIGYNARRMRYDDMLILKVEDVLLDICFVKNV